MEYFMTKRELVFVIGSGQMGSGIAEVFAINKFNVINYDISDTALEKAKKNVRNSLDKFFEKSEIEETPEAVIKRIKYTNNLDECQYANIIIESAFEDFDTKAKILCSLEPYLCEHTYVATNTSSFSITELGRMLNYSENFAGFHFMNPPVLMNLIEVVKGVNTSENTTKFFTELASEIKKEPILVKNSPGFVLNRILIPMINEAAWLYCEGIASAENIDKAMTLGANHKIGPLALADLIGIDTIVAILSTLQNEIDSVKYTPAPVLKDMLAFGYKGRKSGRGFYRY